MGTPAPMRRMQSAPRSTTFIGLLVFRGEPDCFEYGGACCQSALKVRIEDFRLVFNQSLVNADRLFDRCQSLIQIQSAVDAQQARKQQFACEVGQVGGRVLSDERAIRAYCLVGGFHRLLEAIDRCHPDRKAG